MNTHDFKYSMIPFSHFNNSQDVNLFTKQSRIPYLYKDPVVNVSQKELRGMNHNPSRFFKCYSDELYEEILQQYRNHYVAISAKDLDDLEM